MQFSFDISTDIHGPKRMNQIPVLQIPAKLMAFPVTFAPVTVFGSRWTEMQKITDIKAGSE